MSFEQLAGLIIVVLSAGLMLVTTIIKRKSRRKPTLREIAAFHRLTRAIGLAVEDGKRLHVSLGKSSLLEPTNASALIGLSALERVAQSSIISDRPPLATSGDPALSILSQDTLHSVYDAGNAFEQYNPDQGRLTGVTPFSYTAGVLPVIRDERISAHIFTGNFGPEVALLNEAAEREKAYVMASSDSLPAQAVLFGVARDPLIGEELFAIPAYIKGGPVQQASLLIQDVLRWVLVGGILVMSILKFLGFV